MARAAHATGLSTRSGQPWRTLAMGSAVDERMPTLMGKYKVPHSMRREADAHFRDLAFRRRSCSPPSTGQPDPLRHGAEERAGRHARLHPADGRPEAAGYRRRGHREVRLRDLQEGRRGMSAGRSAVAGEHLTGAEMATSSARPWPARSIPTPSPRAYRCFGFPGREDLGNMFQFQAETSPTTSAARAILPSHAR